MTVNMKNISLFALVGVLIIGAGIIQGANTALLILNFGLISAIMSLGVNLQWGLAGLLNVGVMGFVALGGLAAVLVSMPTTYDAWSAGGGRMIVALLVGLGAIIATVFAYKKLPAGKTRTLAILVLLIAGFFLFRSLFDAAVTEIERVNPAGTGYLGGLGLPVIISWPVGGLLAAGAAWVIGKVALGLRSDYLAIATLGIAEIIISLLKNEDWLSRGVKNVVGIPRPVPYEVDLQASQAFIDTAASIGFEPVLASTLFVKLCYAALFTTVLLILLWLSQMALNSPWGRMMRAIRDNEVSSQAMGKNITARHLQIFILGSAICGIAGAMMTTLDSQLTPTAYQPLRFTFLVWVMVIVGGSGNNWGSVLGGFLIWFLWVEVEPMGAALMNLITAPMADGYWLKDHLLESVAHMRLLTMGIILIVVLRFSPKGLIPEK
ncbi:branched-chain amino acid ABC transporter permease [Cochlodiniinecator piscidefendens]|uniref:branched-chain amino acid ABC transporter permease n=1 Tax=Cochlodiniinecator piscidefendens TaxID=2715756 RepID=UPI00140C2622|nr:branched-chain amino acid ABC transporter permease [Cochlodiniinecator piscidefendens]